MFCLLPTRFFKMQTFHIKEDIDFWPCLNSLEQSPHVLLAAVSDFISLQSFPRSSIY